MRSIAVIGAGYGDEGKGKVVDYLCSKLPRQSIVVRYNGGAQAGHTVDTGKVRRVFHHFGSGTLQGVPTYLGPRFVSNPFLFNKEYDELVEMGHTPEVYAHPDGLVSTHADMLLNEILEETRGDRRHGSCGIGFGETIERDQSFHRTALADWNGWDHPNILIDKVVNEWVPARLKSFGIDPAKWPRKMHYMKSDDVKDVWVIKLNLMLSRLSLTEFIPPRRTVIFEGAQGLLLDEVNGSFPYVTRSRTGSHYIRALVDQNNLEAPELVYVTRSYSTRHGAGPFPGYVPEMKFDDPTNIPNYWQGSLRFGNIDYPSIRSAVVKDRSSWKTPPSASLAVNCLDQKEIDIEDLEAVVGLPALYLGHGPSRADVKVGVQELV